jgi:hypothetical protein
VVTGKQILSKIAVLWQQYKILYSTHYNQLYFALFADDEEDEDKEKDRYFNLGNRHG